MDMKDRLRQARKNAGKKQPEVAKHLNVSPQAISQWESGKTAPDRENLLKVAKFYRVSVEALESGDGDLPQPAPDPLEIFLIELKDLGEALPDNAREQALKVLRTFLPQTAGKPRKSA